MADEEQLRLLQRGVKAWNDWRRQAPDTDIDLREAYLHVAKLGEADLSGANLSGAYLRGANLRGANLQEANLRGAQLFEADLSGANLRGADLQEAKLGKAALLFASLRGANLHGADLFQANLSGADLHKAKLGEADLSGANLRGADLFQANLTRANLQEANLRGANLLFASLSGADLSEATLNDADLGDADLTGCRIYGVSAWGLKLSEDTKQQGLIITPKNEPEITTDDIEVAQFIYLLLNNKKIRDVIDTITSKAVLILGRFTQERKVVLDALRDELRKRNYLPILFDFDKPASKDLTGTVTTLANMARFIIADGTDPKSIPHEMATIVPSTLVPVQPILLADQREYAMFEDLRLRHHWVLPTHRYITQQQLIADLSECVIRPAEDKAIAIRNAIAARL
jgi:uncharacterized protein YjbI with pentapeptide repeats